MDALIRKRIQEMRRMQYKTSNSDDDLARKTWTRDIEQFKELEAFGATVNDLEYEQATTMVVGLLHSQERA